jgi:hypothetical protein
MKIKKSELLALIKEEIMNEMDGLTMMDDPRDDDAVPAGMEQGGAMDQVAQEMERMVTTQMDDAISMLSNYHVTSEASSDPTRAASMGMDMLRDAGLAFPDQSALERMIAGDDGMMQEGVDAESMQVVADVAQKMAPLIGVMSLPVLIGLIYEKLKEMGAK